MSHKPSNVYQITSKWQCRPDSLVIIEGDSNMYKATQHGVLKNVQFTSRPSKPCPMDGTAWKLRNNLPSVMGMLRMWMNKEIAAEKLKKEMMLYLFVGMDMGIKRYKYCK